MHLVRWVASATLVVVGLCLLVAAYAGRRLERYREPLPANLSELEQGTPPPSIHVSLDTHWEVRGRFGYTHDRGDPDRARSVCLLITSDRSPFQRALRANPAGDPTAALREAPLAQPVLVVTDRYETVSAIPENDELVGPSTGTLQQPGSKPACARLMSDLGISGNDYLIVEEGGTPMQLPFVPLALLGFLFLLSSPVPLVWARHLDRRAPSLAPSSSVPSGAPASAYPRASSVPPAASLPPPDRDLRLGASVIVRRGAQRLAATVVAVEPGRCRCEFDDGKQAAPP